MATKTKKRERKTDDGKLPIGMSNIDQVKEMLSGISLKLGGFGVQRQVAKAENDLAAEALEAEPAAIKTSRLLIDRNMEEYKDVSRIRTACREWFYSLTLPYPVDNIRLFRRDMRDKIMAEADEWRGRIRRAASRLTLKSEEILAWARKSLGRAFDAKLYPEDYCTEYTFDLREHSIEPPSYLAASNAESYKRELARRMSDIEAGMQQFERQCMEQIGGNVSRLVSAMSGGTRLEGSNLEQMRKVFQRIATLKFQGTAVFKQAMEEFKESVDGVGASELRRPGGVRDETKAKLEGLMTRYKSLLEAKKQAVASEA